MPSDKIKTIEALRKLANDTSTTKEERAAAIHAIKTLGGNIDDAMVSSSKSDINLICQIDLAKFKMPEWVNDIRFNPCPHIKIVRKLNDRMFGGSGYREQTHNAFVKYETYRGSNSRQVQRDGFIFEQYIRLAIMNIWVSISDAKMYERFYTHGLHEDDRGIEIYSDNTVGGWRDGPWWKELDDVIGKWSQEADEMDEAYRQKLAAEKLAEQNKKDDLFSRYVRRKG